MSVNNYFNMDVSCDCIFIMVKKTINDKIVIIND